MKKVGVIFGGMSNEAEVSVMSARNILAQLDRTKYEPVAIFWRRDGKFMKVSDADHLDGEIISVEDMRKIVDVAFPITHGKFGEDGVLQGMLEALKIPYCGCRVLSSAVCMDKAIFKALMASANIPQTKYIVLNDGEEIDNPDFAMPWFVKPANSGSSVGVTRVDSPAQLQDAIRVAREHDAKVLIEQGVQNAVEIEVAILGNDKLTISVPGQIIPSREFYDYEDKYIAGASRVVIPAPLDAVVAERVKTIAEEAYRLADCRGFARVDFFVKGDDVLVSEINTLPGFTDISMYPKLMEASGISYKDLLSRIIELA
jgi:D-alanine-D-alanine ligase